MRSEGWFVCVCVSACVCLRVCVATLILALYTGYEAAY